MKSIFAEAMERAPADRSAFLDEACRSLDSIRREVDALLDSHRSATEFMRELFGETASGAGTERPAPDTAPPRSTMKSPPGR